MAINKLKAIFAYHDAVQDGKLEAAQRILRLLIYKRKRFYNDDADWVAETYLNRRGIRESSTDRRGYYATYDIKDYK